MGRWRRPRCGSNAAPVSTNAPPDELAAFRDLNAAYLARFGLPFIIAVKGLSRADILAAFADRLENDPEAEFATALAEIHRIAGFRLAALFDPE